MNPLGVFNFARAVQRLGRSDRRRFGVSYFSQLREVSALRRLNGLEPHEYFLYQLSNPALTWDEKAAYLSYNQGCALHRELSPLSDRAVTEKFITERYFRWFNLPTPRIYGLFDPRFGQAEDGQPLKSADDFKEFICRLPVDKFVLKPAAGAKGYGITVIVGRNGATWTSASGERLSGEQLYQRALEGWEHTTSSTPLGLLIQEYVEQHEVLREIQPGSLNTLRVITFLNDQGEVEILATLIKFAVGSGMVDNVSQGGLAAGVDDHGIIQNAIVENSGSYEPVAIHPSTGRQIAGVEVPFYQEAVDLARRGQMHIPQLRTLGWDIAITSGGPVIIETNVFWGNVTQAIIRRGMITSGLRKVLDRIK
jgi:hypothetical protein